MRLEPFGDTHLETLTGMLGDPEILRFTRVPEPTPPDFARTWLESYEAGRRDGTREAFAALGENDAFLGLALAPSIDREAGEVELATSSPPPHAGAASPPRSCASSPAGRSSRERCVPSW